VNADYVIDITTSAAGRGVMISNLPSRIIPTEAVRPGNPNCDLADDLVVSSGFAG